MKTTVKLKDIASYSKGSQINGNNLIEDGAYEYLNGGINPSGKWNEYNVDGNTITISEGGNSCGYVNYMINPFWCGAHCYYLYNLKCSSKYLYYALKGSQSSIMKLRSGACMPNIKKKDLGEFILSIDLDKKEQDKTIKIFNKLQSIITHLSTQLEKLDLLVKARFVEIFGDTEYNTKKFPVYKLSELCTVSSSKRIYQDEQSSTDVPFLRISNLVELIETGHLKNELFISDEKYIELVRSNLVPQKGDILVTSRGTLGKCYIVQDDDKFYFQDGMISWLYNLNKAITPLYLALLFNTRNIKAQIDNLQSGSTVAYLSITMLKKLNIVVPPLTLQNQFADFVKQIDKSKSILQQELDKAQMLFDSLMQEYFG